MQRLFRQFSVSRWRAEPRVAGDPGIDQRRWRARLLARPRDGCGVGQPRSHRDVSSETVRPKPERWRRAGTSRRSSIRSATVPCCRCFISTATRSPIRRSSGARPTPTCGASSRATAGDRRSSTRRRSSTIRAVHEPLAAAFDAAIDAIQAIQAGARAGSRAAVARAAVAPWPMLVLRSPKGWTGPAEVDGLPVEGTWRAHQVPLAEVRDNAADRRQLEEWLLSYGPDELFDEDGLPRADVVDWLPCGARPSRRQPPCQRRSVAP